MRKGKKKPPPRFMTVKEAAEALTLSPKTVYRMVDKGELPGLNFGGAVRISRAGLEEYIARQMAKGLQTEDAPSPRAVKQLVASRPAHPPRNARQQPRRFQCVPRD